MMHFFTRSLLPFLLRLAAVCLVVGAITLLLIPLRNFLGVQVLALIYLLPVILSTFLWGLTPGILAGLTSFLAFNYFFVPPYHTLAVHRTQDLITLGVFLFVAVIISQLIGQAQAGTQLAKRREWEATQMYNLISALAGLQDTPSIGKTLAQHALETFRGNCVEVYIKGLSDPSPLTVCEPNGVQEGGRPTISCPMMTVHRIEGEIRLWMNRPVLTEEENRLLNTFASQGALAIERIHLSQSETRARILEETDKAKSSLLSSVSHELRSPLAVIKASVSSLASDMVSWDSEARHELLTTIEEETDNLNFLVGNLLDMSRIEAGALKPRRQWNTLSEIASGSITRLHKALEEYQIELDFPANTPLVPVDYVLIEQVFTNLLSNSSKYAPPHSLITISSRREHDSVHVRVTNQGPAVPESDLERIFDKFNRVTVSDRITGTGLGLSICKGIIEAHDGKIWAENEPGCFAFHFTLPIKLDGHIAEVPLEGS
jgi:two-component system, OmpR family, sensor histidine kinase KdpD